MFRLIRCLILITSITSLGIGNLFAYQEEVDWIWNDVKSTARQGPACMKYIVKAYPIKILNWHEIVNDTLTGKPVVHFDI